LGRGRIAAYFRREKITNLALFASNAQPAFGRFGVHFEFFPATVLENSSKKEMLWKKFSSKKYFFWERQPASTKVRLEKACFGSKNEVLK